MLKIMAETADKEKRTMVHTGSYKEAWVDVGVDEDGTEAFLDENGIVRDLENALFKVWIKHVPPPGSRTYAEMEQALKASHKSGRSPHHVKLLAEIDLPKGLSRTLNLVVCDREGAILDTISFRFPEWSKIEDNIIDGVSSSIAARFPDAPRAEPRTESLRFRAPGVYVKPERIEVSRRYQIDKQQRTSGTSLKLQEVDV